MIFFKYSAYILLNFSDKVTERISIVRSATNRNRVVRSTIERLIRRHITISVPPPRANLLYPHRLFRESIHQVPLQLPTSTALGHTPFAFALKHIISLPFLARRQRVTTELPKKEAASSGRCLEKLAVIAKSQFHLNVYVSQINN